MKDQDKKPSTTTQPIQSERQNVLGAPYRSLQYVSEQVHAEMKPARDLFKLKKKAVAAVDA